MNADHLIFKRKYKTNPTKNSSKWWFVIRSDEALLKDLEEKWHLIVLQTNWKIEPVLRFSDTSKGANSIGHSRGGCTFQRTPYFPRACNLDFVPLAKSIMSVG